MKKKIIITVVLATLVVILGTTAMFNNKSLTDAMKFKKEYELLNGQINSNNKKYMDVEISVKNPIQYASYEEIVNLLKSGTGVIYFGFPECPWCRNAVPVLLEAAKELNINKIYYFNALSIRDKKHLDDQGNIVTDEAGTKEYEELVKLMYDQLPVYDGLNDDTIKRLYFPTVVFVKNGEIIGLHSSTVDSQEDPYVSLTDDQHNELKKIYSDYFNKVFDIVCDDAC